LRRQGAPGLTDVKVRCSSLKEWLRVRRPSFGRLKTATFDWQFSAAGTDTKIKTSGLDLSYDNQWGRYRLSMNREGVQQHRGLIKELVNLAYHGGKNA
jgi:hypothetical protein